MAKVTCDPRKVPQRVAVVKTETESAADGGQIMPALRLTVARNQNEQGEWAYSLMKECCTGACWYATIDYRIRYTEGPWNGRFRIPIVPCVGKVCNVTAGHDMDPVNPQNPNNDIEDPFDSYEPRYQWGGTVNFGEIFNLASSPNRGLNIDFGFNPAQGQPGTPRGHRLFMRMGVQWGSLFHCPGNSIPQNQQHLYPSNKPIAIMEKPTECMFYDWNADLNGQYANEEGTDQMAGLPLGEMFFGEYFFYSMSNRYCAYKYDSRDEVPELGMLPSGLWGQDWGITSGTLFFMWPPPGNGEGRFFKEDWTPAEGAEEWLSGSMPVAQGGGNVFMLDGEMEAYLDGGGWTYLNGLNPGDPIVGVPSRKLLLPTGPLELIYSASGVRSAKVESATISSWTRCDRRHGCITYPFPILEYDIRPRPSTPPTVMEPPLVAPYRGRSMTPFGALAGTAWANVDAEKCLHYDASTGQCKLNGADFNCAECDHSVGLSFDV